MNKKSREIARYLYDTFLSPKEVKRLRRMFFTYALTVVFCFLPYVYFIESGFSPVLSLTITLLTFVFLVFFYLIIFETDFHLIPRLLIVLISRSEIYKIWVVICLSLFFLVSTIISVISRDFVFLSNFLVIFILILAIFTGVYIRLIVVSNNLIKLWKKSNLSRLIIFVGGVVYLIGLLSFNNRSMRFPILRIVVEGFLFSYLVTSLMTRYQFSRLRSIETNVLDFADFNLQHKKVQVRKIYLLILDGKIISALIKFLRYRKHLTEVEKCKIKSRIYYRLGKHNSVLDLTGTFLNKQYSGVLLSLRALSLLRLGYYIKAIRLLEDRLRIEHDKSVESRNPYIPLNLAYAYWQVDEIDRALSLNEEALKISQNKCLLALNNQAYFRCEEALLRYHPRSRDFENALEDAENWTKRAVEKLTRYYYCTVKDTQGYVALLKLDFDSAVNCFSRITHIYNDSRLHIALFYMINSLTYYRAEYYLKRILTSLRRTPDHKLYRLARLNLEKVEHARNKNVFNHEIVYCLHKKFSDIPDYVMTKEPIRDEEIEKIKSKLNIKLFEVFKWGGISFSVFPPVEGAPQSCVRTK